MIALAFAAGPPATRAETEGGDEESPAAIGGDVRDWRRFEPLSSSDRHVLQQQRQAVKELFVRQFGSGPTGSRSDVGRIQRLLDARVLRARDTFELQSLGAVLGDVMVVELGLEWIAYTDDAGRSRALRLGNTDLVVFPVTMISRRVERDVGVDVEALLARIRDLVAENRPTADR